jgi:adenosylcobyric acid synthase
VRESVAATAMSARTLMIQGTASSVGKSLIVAALCRIFWRRGLRVAPFKSQNMALNSFVTPDGLEIGRAQAVQAEAAGIEPAVEMNPILLKPEAGGRSQVVVMGRPLASMTWADYRSRMPSLGELARRCLERLREAYDLVIIEGAGNPAEINLKSSDIVNMHVARLADAPVVMVGDIDRGGVFAQLVGTMELLADDERARVAAFLINKFRGDAALLKPGLDFLAARHRVPVLGVIPFIERLKIADEDSVALEDRRGRCACPDGALDIAVVRLPTIANYDDFLVLEHEPATVVRFVASASEMADADLVIIPGSKSTVADLDWMRAHGLAEAIAARARRGNPILGICGGCQMLGEVIEDPGRIESDRPVVEGLGLLPLRTLFEPAKRTARVLARAETPSFLAHGSGEITGYEIHMGRVARTPRGRAAFRLRSRNAAPCDELDGAVSENGAVVGTMIHGIFENRATTASMLGELARRKGVRIPALTDTVVDRAAEYDRLASVVREHIDLAMLERIARL